MKIEPIVYKILKNSERARNDDFYLYGQVICMLDPQNSYRTISDLFLGDHSKLPPFESVTRCRRKLQANNEDLQANSRVKALRKYNEEVMKNYALN